jgi:hypothetical protein
LDDDEPRSTTTNEEVTSTALLGTLYAAVLVM